MPYNKEAQKKYISTHREEWRDYLSEYYNIKYHTNEEFRKKESERKKIAYQKKKALKAHITI
jgi:hypothetical protein